MELLHWSALLIGVTGFCGAQTIHLEAENGELEGPTIHAVRPDTSAQPGMPGSGGGSIRTGYSGPGYVTGFATQADRLVLKFKAKTAGLYDLRIAYATGNSKGYAFEVNGAQMSGMFPASAGGEFAVVSAGKVELNAGANVLAIDRGWGFFDVDYVELTATIAAPPPPRPLAALSDAHGSPEAVALLAKIDDAYGKGTMVGVYNDEDAKYTVQTTGFQPGIMGADLLDYAATAVEHDTHPHEVERLIEDAKAGYTITLSWHWRPPLGVYDKIGPNGENLRWYMSFYTKGSSFDVTVPMNDPQSKERAALEADIDRIAVQLKRLDAAGIPVLWRPLHEAQGAWFWWGAKGPKAFVWLWQFMYNRLVNVDGVHNLVWVFTSGDDPAWYPGDAYVDVVGIDAYPKDLHSPENPLWELLAKQFYGRKPLAISEFGGVPDIPKMQRYGEYWSYAVSWSGKLGPKENDPVDLQRIYASDWVLKRKAQDAEAVGESHATKTN